MADKKNKYPQNKTGRYYVDNECIACDACVLAAPDNFEMNEDEGHAYVNAQPKDDEENEMCIEAMEACPVEAIGNDGE